MKFKKFMVSRKKREVRAGRRQKTGIEAHLIGHKATMTWQARCRKIISM
jgi:hypothetical protein